MRLVLGSLHEEKSGADARCYPHIYTSSTTPPPHRPNNSHRLHCNGHSIPEETLQQPISFSSVLDVMSDKIVMVIFDLPPCSVITETITVTCGEREVPHPPPPPPPF